MRGPSPVVLLLLIAACTAPTEGTHNPVAGAQRVLAVDFAPSVIARRQQALQRLPGHVAHEAHRAARIGDVPADAAAELTRTADIPRTASTIAGGEAARTGNIPHTVAAIVPTPEEVGQRLADDLGNTPAYLGLTHRPLREVDDREHRTDPDDDRPEKTLWQRLARRLGLRW
jgi:hypothetical protein